MSVFDTAVQALFRDPNITESALWRPGGVGAGIAIRIIRTRPQAEFDIGGVKLLQDPVLFDVPAGMAPTIAENDTIEAGGALFKIQSPPVRSMDGRIWRVDVRRM